MAWATGPFGRRELRGTSRPDARDTTPSPCAALSRRFSLVILALDLGEEVEVSAELRELVVGQRVRETRRRVLAELVPSALCCVVLLNSCAAGFG